MSVHRTADLLSTHTRAQIRHALAAGRWQRPARGVVVTHNGVLSVSDQEEIALAVAPGRAALAGASALARDGLTLADPRSVQIVLPEGARRPEIDGVEYHWSTELTDADVHPLRAPRRTRVARSACDAAAWAASDRSARLYVIAPVQQGLINAAGLYDALTRRGPCRRHGLILESIHDAAGGIASLPEADFDELRAKTGLPRPDRQVVRKGPDGRYYLDAHWARWRITAEVHGAQHQQIDRWDADLRRSNELVIAGDRLLIFSSYAIRHQPYEVERQLRAAFRAAGASR